MVRPMYVVFWSEKLKKIYITRVTLHSLSNRLVKIIIFQAINIYLNNAKKLYLLNFLLYLTGAPF